MAPHRGRESAVLGSDAIDIAPARQEVVVNETNDVEAVGHDARVGEVQAYQGAAVRRQTTNIDGRACANQPCAAPNAERMTPML